MAWQTVILFIAIVTLAVWMAETRMRVNENAERTSELMNRVKTLEEAGEMEMDAARRRTRALQLENSRLRTVLGEQRGDEDVFPAKQNLRVSFVQRGGTEYDKDPGGTQP